MKVGQHVRENLSWSDTRVLWFIPTAPGWLPLCKVTWARLENPCRGRKGISQHVPKPSPSSLTSPVIFQKEGAGDWWDLGFEELLSPWAKAKKDEQQELLSSSKSLKHSGEAQFLQLKPRSETGHEDWGKIWILICLKKIWQNVRSKIVKGWWLTGFQSW